MVHGKNSPMKRLLNMLFGAFALGVFAAGEAVAGQGAADAPAEKPLEERIVGYWAPNWDEISVAWKPMFEQLATLSLGDRTKEGFAKYEQKIADDAQAMCRVMTMEITRDQFILHHGADGEREVSGYVVKSVDANAGTLEVEVSSPDGGEQERGRFVLSGDRLTLATLPEGSSVVWILDRIDKQAFEKRQALAAEAKLGKDAGAPPNDGAPTEPADGNP
jgi:hypothetical protein